MCQRSRITCHLSPVTCHQHQWAQPQTLHLLTPPLCTGWFAKKEPKNPEKFLYHKNNKKGWLSIKTLLNDQIFDKLKIKLLFYAFVFLYVCCPIQLAISKWLLSLCSSRCALGLGDFFPFYATLLTATSRDEGHMMMQRFPRIDCVNKLDSNQSCLQY